jgi:hypothetical protein
VSAASVIIAAKVSHAEIFDRTEPSLLTAGVQADHHWGTVESLAEVIKIRVTDDNRAAFAGVAAAEGLSLSAWARRPLKRIAKKGAKKTDRLKVTRSVDKT